MRRSPIPEVNEPSLSDCGWDHEGNIIWIEEAYPGSIVRLLVESDHESNKESDEEDMDEYFGEDCVSDEDE